MVDRESLKKDRELFKNLPADRQERYLALEIILAERRHEYDFHFAEVEAARKNVTKQVMAFCDSNNISYEFKGNNDPLDLNPMNPNVEICKGTINVRGKFKQETIDELTTFIETTKGPLLEAYKKFRTVFARYAPFACESVMEFSRIDVIGHENPSYTDAVAYIVGRSNYDLKFHMNMATARLNYTIAIRNPRVNLTKEWQEQIRIAHDGHEYNTYVISHPSAHIDFDDLARHISDILTKHNPTYEIALENKRAIDELTEATNLFAMKKPSGMN